MDVLAATKVLVPSKFDGVANAYDVFTGASPGYHRDLRASASRMKLGPGAEVLDLCCGTGSSTAAIRASFPDATIVGLDASRGMLEKARRKEGINARFVHGDAMDPAASGLSGPYDGILMAYGIRNMPDRDACLESIKELLKPGGVISFHEYSVADSALATLYWDAMCWGLIIPGGLLTAPRSDIYRYLWRSVRAFDGVSAFKERLEGHGFVDVQAFAMKGLQRGVTHTFTARRPV